MSWYSTHWFQRLYEQGQTKMAHSLTTIGLHLECAIQAEIVVELELALIERNKSIICKKATKGFESVPRSKVV